MIPDQRFVIFDGDSITLGVPSNPGSIPYPTQTLALLGGQYSGYNSGFSGNTSNDVVSGVVAEIDAKMSVNYKKQYVVLLIGTNDITVGVAEATTLANIASYVARRRKTGAVVLVGTVIYGFDWWTRNNATEY